MRFRFPLSLWLVAATTVGCAGPEDTAGADLVITRGTTSPPVRLMLSWFGETTLLFRKPVDLARTDDEPLARLRIVSAEATGRRVALVQGLSSADEVLSEGVLAISLTPGQVTSHTIPLGANRMPDGDGDGVPDVADECPQDPSAFFGCEPKAVRRPDAQPIVTAPPALDAAPVMVVAKDAAVIPTPVDSPPAPPPPKPPVDAAILLVDAPIDTNVVRDIAAPIPPPDAAPTCRAILVGDNGAATEADMVAADLLKAQGCMVVDKDQSTVKVADLAGATLTVISPSAGESQAYKFLKVSTVPLLVLEREALDDLGISGAVDGTDFGSQVNEDTIHINMAGHPLAGGLQSAQAILELPTLALGWAIPQGMAARIVSLGSNNSRYFAFGYEANATLSGTTKTPARWAAFLAGSTALPQLNKNGEKMFNAAVRWLLTKP